MKRKFVAWLPLLCLLFGVGCEGSQSEEGSGSSSSNSSAIILVANKGVIRSDGEDAVTLTVYTEGESGEKVDITASVELYCEGDNNPMNSSVFASTEKGTYRFYALYGFSVSNTVQVIVTEGIRDLPQDEEPESTAFAHRILLLQHTGTACPNCPTLMNLLKVLSEDEECSLYYHHVASHSYRSGDPAYSAMAVLISRTMNSTMYYPWLTYNLTQEYDDGTSYTEIKEAVERLHQERAVAGLSAAASLVDGVIYTHIGIKSGKSNRYRVATWVLEDNIAEPQSGATAQWQNIHNNCLRGASGANDMEQIYGTLLGEIEAGQTREYISSVAVGETWKGENCKVMVLLTADDGTGEYGLVNCIVCPLDGVTPYIYNNQ